MDPATENATRLPYRLQEYPAADWLWATALFAATALLLLACAGFFGWIAVVSFPSGRILAALMALLAAAAAVLGGWSVLQVIALARTRLYLGPTAVQVSAASFQPGQEGEWVVRQAAPLHARHWRVCLVCAEQSVVWGTAPDPLNPQGQVLQPILHGEILRRDEVDHRLDVVVPIAHEACFRGRFRIPDDAPPSSWSRARALIWSLNVEGDLDGWPRFTRIFPIDVKRPGEVAQAG
jgi:hypothetical protein